MSQLLLLNHPEVQVVSFLFKLLLIVFYLIHTRSPKTSTTRGTSAWHPPGYHPYVRHTAVPFQVFNLQFWDYVTQYLVQLDLSPTIIPIPGTRIDLLPPNYGPSAIGAEGPSLTLVHHTYAFLLHCSFSETHFFPATMFPTQVFFALEFSHVFKFSTYVGFDV